MTKKYIVRLSEAERAELEALVKTGRAAARKRLHAQVLLKELVGWVERSETHQPAGHVTPIGFAARRAALPFLPPDSETSTACAEVIQRYEI
jgi:hypothetical protein